MLLSVSRRRLGALGAAVVVIVAFLVLAGPALPCQLPGGDECAPPDNAVDLVPAGALAYVHVTVDPDREQFEDASEVGSRLPVITRQEVVQPLLAQLPGRGGVAARFDRDIEPWLAEQMAVALLPGDGRSLEQVQLLEVADADRAARYVRSVAGEEPGRARHRGVRISSIAPGLAGATLDGFLAVGSGPALRAVIDTHRGAKGARSLADADPMDDATDALPDGRFAHAYVSRRGVTQLITPRRSVLSRFAPLISPGATRGIGVALGADDDGLRLAVRSVLDPELAESKPGFFSAFDRFEPALAGELSEDALAYLGFGDPGRAVRRLLGQAGDLEPRLAAGFTELIGRVRKLGKIDVRKQLLPALGDEAALALEPGAQPRRPGAGQARGPSERGGAIPGFDQEGTGGLPGLGRPGRGAQSPVAGLSAPYAAFLSEGADERRARGALARLQVPIIRALGPGAASSFEQRQIADVEAQGLRISPALDLTYGVFDSKVVVASDPAAIRQFSDGDGGLDDSDMFERATKGFSDEPSLLAYLNLTDLVRLAERAGLAADPAYVAFASEIRRLEAMGVAVVADDDLLSTDLRLVVGEDEDEDE